MQCIGKPDIGNRHDKAYNFWHHNNYLPPPFSHPTPFSYPPPPPKHTSSPTSPPPSPPSQITDISSYRSPSQFKCWLISTAHTTLVFQDYGFPWGPSETWHHPCTTVYCTGDALELYRSGGAVVNTVVTRPTAVQRCGQTSLHAN